MHVQVKQLFRAVFLIHAVSRIVLKVHVRKRGVYFTTIFQLNRVARNGIRRIPEKIMLFNFFLVQVVVVVRKQLPLPD